VNDIEDTIITISAILVTVGLVVTLAFLGGLGWLAWKIASKFL
jgi:hypothetical protein